jgi:hypothetical protein
MWIAAGCAAAITVGCAAPPAVPPASWMKSGAGAQELAADLDLCDRQARAEMYEQMQYLPFVNQCMRQRGWDRIGGQTGAY